MEAGVPSKLPPPSPRDLLEWVVASATPGPTRSILDPEALGDLVALAGEVARGREGVLLPWGTRVGYAMGGVCGEEGGPNFNTGVKGGSVAGGGGCGPEGSTPKLE